MPRDGSKPATKPQRPAQVAAFNVGWLATLDKRTALFQSLAARLHQLHEDLGGFDALSVQKQVLCERAVFLEMRVRDIESRAVAGEDVNWSTYGFLVNALGALMAKLGLERKVRHVDPRSYIDQKAAQS